MKIQSVSRVKLAILTNILFLSLLLLAFPSQAQIVKSKDGVKLGSRQEFISSCIKGAKNELMEYNGMKFKTKKYCTCICDNLLPKINSWELKRAVSKNKMMELFMKDKNLEIVMQCLDGNYSLADDFKFDSTSNLDMKKKIGIKTCVKEVLNNEESKGLWSKELAQNYCDCAINKLYSAGYTYKDIQNLEDENSEAFNAIVVPCITETFKNEQTLESSNAYNPEDISGDKLSSSIPLVDYLGQGYKIKISISGVVKYFLFDTGASDLIIDSDTERELLLNGTLKRENYLGKTEYELANNEKIEAQEIKVDNITIGDYTVNNVVVAVFKEGSLLCGKSFLDKFKKWELDKENKLLILYK